MSTAKPGPKEAIYDNQISPMMRQIIALCMEHKINMVADFCLGPEIDEDTGALGIEVQCTTILPVDPDDKSGYARVSAASKVLAPKPGEYPLVIPYAVRPS